MGVGVQGLNPQLTSCEFGRLSLLLNPFVSEPPWHGTLSWAASWKELRLEVVAHRCNHVTQEDAAFLRLV